ncbi:MAG: hypothetical protein J6K42_00250 [Clostridia bacterium]|nr:hypothetical protein [Clostridia bacterium]
MKGKALIKKICILAIVVLIIIAGYIGIFMQSKIINNNIQLGEDKEYYASKYYDNQTYLNAKNFGTIENDYIIPSLTGADIIKEATKYYGVRTWEQGKLRVY